MSNQYIDIFAGCGGLSLGLHNAGWNGLFAVEKNKDAFATLQHNLIEKRAHFSWVDWLEVCNHDINELLLKNKNDLEVLRGRVPLVVGGPPCQGFSMAGQRDKDDIRNKLVDSYVEFVEIVRPNYIFFENVPGITIGFKNKKNVKETPQSSIVVKKLEKIGYSISFRVLDLSDYGIPQKRKRFILIGSLVSEPNEFFDILEKEKKKFLGKHDLKETVTIGDAIGDLLLTNGTIDCPDSKKFYSGKYGKMNSTYQKHMRKNIEKSENPTSHRFAKHKPDTVDLFTRMFKECPIGIRLSKKNTTLEGFNRRGITILDKDKSCGTITSHPDDYLHFSECRILTVRECARIQSFPDWYEFKGKYTTGGDGRKTDVPRYTQVGNAIPPLFAEQVGLALKKLMEKNKNG